MPTLQITLNSNEEDINLIHDLGSQLMKLRQVIVEYGIPEDPPDIQTGLLVDLSRLGASTSEILGYTPNVQSTPHFYIPRPGKNSISISGGTTTTIENKSSLYTSSTFFENTNNQVSFVPDLPAVDRWQVNDTFLCNVDEVHTVSDVQSSGSQLTDKAQNGFGGTTSPTDTKFITQNTGASESVTLFADGRSTQSKTELGIASAESVGITNAGLIVIIDFVTDVSGIFQENDVIQFSTYRPEILFTIIEFLDDNTRFSAFPTEDYPIESVTNTDPFDMTRVLFPLPDPLPFVVGDTWIYETSSESAKEITGVGVNSLTFGSPWLTTVTTPNFGDWTRSEQTRSYITLTPPLPTDVVTNEDAFFRVRSTGGSSSTIDVSDNFFIMHPNLSFHTGDVLRDFVIRTYKDTNPIELADFSASGVRQITFYFEYETNDVNR